jgi:chromosome segregation ATPase
MLEKVSVKLNDVDTKLRDLGKASDEATDRVNKNANRILIPAAIAVMLACVLGAWGVLGGSMVGLRNEAQRLTEVSRALETQVAAKQTELAALDKAIDKVKGDIDKFNADLAAARKNSGAVDEEPRLKKLEAAVSRIDRIEGQVDTLARVTVAKAGAQTPPAPAGVHTDIAPQTTSR